MAFVKTCPTCGFGNVPTSPFCSECGVSLVGIAPSDHVALAAQESDDEACNAAKSVCPDCKAENEAGTVRCIYCDCVLKSVGDRAASCHIELIWPWGKDSLTKPLRIGRDAPAPESLIKAINAHGYDNISRSHAELVPDFCTGRVSLIDLGSTNGTFVDGVRIPPHMPTLLKSGTVVRFAADFSVSVLITEV